MLKTAIGMLALIALQASPTGVAGTWNMTLMSHQVGMVLEQNGKAVTGTLMMMGKDVPLEGEFADGKLTVTGKGALMGAPAEHGGSGDAPKPIPIKLTAKLLDDGTLDGEMETAKGPAKWTAERLRTKK
jgi:hypothetical protein